MSTATTTTTDFASAKPPACFGPRLQAARKARGLTQTGVAKQLGLSYHTYLRYEWSKTSPHGGGLAAIARFFNVSPAWLLGCEDLPVKPAALPPVPAKARAR